MSKEKIKPRASWLIYITLSCFITLKLTKVINWNWWWVTAPLWILPALLLILGSIVIVLIFFTYTISAASVFLEEVMDAYSEKIDFKDKKEQYDFDFEEWSHKRKENNS